MNDLVLSDNMSYETMAAAMGVTHQTGKRDLLPRVKINSQSITALQNIKGKNTKVEVVPAGAFRMEIDGTDYFAETIVFRPYLQRFMLKRYHEPKGDKDGYYEKTIMSVDPNVDMKDTNGGINCGRPAYVKDWDAAPESVKSLIRAIKRTRMIFGEVTMVDAVNAQGDEVKLDTIPALLETSSKGSFANLEAPFQTCAKRKILPIQTTMTLSTEGKPKNDGSLYYILVVNHHDASADLALDDHARTILQNFMDYVKQYNTYVEDQWNKANGRATENEEAQALLSRLNIQQDDEGEFIDVPSVDSD